jgi:hypothetical protein
MQRNQLIDQLQGFSLVEKQNNSVCKVVIIGAKQNCNLTRNLISNIHKLIASYLKFVRKN